MMKNWMIMFARLILTISLLLVSVFPGNRVTTAQVHNIHLLERTGRSINKAVSPTATTIAWDDADSHKWIGENWGEETMVDWVEFDGGLSSRVVITNSLANNWGVMRTDAFPAEDWEIKTGFRADIFQAGGASGIDVKLEVRKSDFDTIIEFMYCDDLQPNTWNTCTWIFNTGINDYSQVSHLSMVFDHLDDSSPTFYVDNLRLLTGAVEEEWDDMDDSSRQWFYFGNWINWAPDTKFGLDPISHNGNHPTTPAGSVFLLWDYPNGIYTGTTAEVGTSLLAGLNDWSGFNRVSADVKVSTPNVPLSVFLWDTEAAPGFQGFGTPTQVVSVADTWQRITWDLPWPPGFDNTDVDELKFIVNNIDDYQTGTIYIDNITLISDPLPEPVSGLAYIFEDYNDNNSEFFNDFNGNWGALNGDYISTTFDTNIYSGTWGASLRLDYALPAESFTGMWHSIWGHSDYPDMSLDFTNLYGDLQSPPQDFEQLQFWVRGSGTTTATLNIKVELKDISNHAAYRYFTIDDGNPNWQKIVLDADVTNASFWNYTEMPDPTHMKQLVFVVESYFNPPAGSFYLDHIQFVDAEGAPFDLNAQTDDEFLDFVSENTFLYFLDWYDPDTGLFQDRSTFPDLMSTAATGFGLTALTIGESRGWISRPVAVEMITTTLQTLYEGQSVSTTYTDTITSTNGYRGFYYHFLDTDGLRKDGSELSPVDTALLIFGALTVREYFNDVPEIVTLVDQLYERIDWDWMLDTSPALDPDSAWFYLAWKPECGSDYNNPDSESAGCFSDYYWNYYTDEVILINLLAIGSPDPEHRISKDVFYEWMRVWGTYGDHTFVQSWSGSLFTYFFAHLWVDFYLLGKDNYPSPSLQVDWWENSVAAAQTNRQFGLDHQDDTVCDGDDDYTTYGPNRWGLTASDGPDDAYHAYGTSPAGSPPVHDGTVQPYGAGSSIMFLPDEALSALKHYFSETDLWRYRFGFGDAYNLDAPDCDNPWYNHAAFGIDQGPMLLAIENHRSGLIWDLIKQNHAVGEALCTIWCDLSISGPAEGFINHPYTFTATISPTITATLPLTYVWQTTGQEILTHQEGLTDEGTFSWASPGTYVITVTVSNSLEVVTSQTYSIVIYPQIYLPIVLREGP